MNFIDINPAFLQADAIRDVYVDFPAGGSDAGMCDRLKKSMCCTRGASQNWQYAYTHFMASKSPSSQCVLWHPERELRRVVHGDHSAVLGWETELNWFWARTPT